MPKTELCLFVCHGTSKMNHKHGFRDAKTHMETLNTLMAANGHDKKKVFYLKVGFYLHQIRHSWFWQCCDGKFFTHNIWRWILKGQNWLLCHSGLSRVLLIRWVGWLSYLFFCTQVSQWVDIHIVFIIFVSGPRWNNLPWSFICRLYTNRKGTVFSSLTKCSKIIFIKHSWTGFNGCWKCCNNCTPWDSALSATKWTWRWANPSFAEIRKQVKELIFAGEEPICYKGLPCLPRSRSHERLSLELSWPELVISRQEPGW